MAGSSGPQPGGQTFGSQPAVDDVQTVGTVESPDTPGVGATAHLATANLATMSVDVDQLHTAAQWLTACKAHVDQLIVNLTAIPPMVGDPTLNGDPPDAAKAPAPAPGATVARAGALGAPGPTKFGLFPHAIALAATHVSTYNNVLAALDKLSHDLRTAIDATAYIAKQYRSAEEAATADIARIMLNPPYVPQEQR